MFLCIAYIKIDWRGSRCTRASILKGIFCNLLEQSGIYLTHDLLDRSSRTEELESRSGHDAVSANGKWIPIYVDSSKRDLALKFICISLEMGHHG